MKTKLLLLPAAARMWGVGFLIKANLLDVY